MPGEHGPLHRECNTIFPLWGCECYSAKLCLKTSFIIHRLQTEIIFDNLCRKQAAFWLLASLLKGGNTCSLSNKAPGESTDNLLTPFPRKGPKCFSGTKSPHCLKHLFILCIFLFLPKARHIKIIILGCLHFYFGC